MRRFVFLSIAALFAANALHAVSPVMSRKALEQVTKESISDGIPSGWCGRAMLSILRKSGLGEGLKGGNGQDWEQILAGAGWKPVRVKSPRSAPLGSVLVYLGDRKLGKTPRGTPGGYHGHVEMVALAPGGGRLYVADCPRPSPGGTVPDNFTGRAWVPPKTMVATAPPINVQVETVLEERLKMAAGFFDRGTTELAKLQLTSGQSVAQE
ncbi:MAG: hypothetical protein WEB60_00135 [Terrimicrobiaceae bacterium]